MTPEQFEVNLKLRQQELKQYMNVVWPREAGETALRFIDGNFRAQGWQGASFQPWKPNRRKGSILVHKGKMRRRNRFRTSIESGMPMVQVYNDSKQARLHNEGFKGTVQVPAHMRRIFKDEKRETGKILASGRMQVRTVQTLSKTVKVKAHIRKVNMPKRQFMPTSWNDSPVLANALKRKIESHLKAIFKP